MTQGPRQIPPWGSKIVRAIGKANLWLAAVGVVVLLLNVWGFHQAASFLPSFGGEEGKIVKTAFLTEYITSGIWLLTQAYLGWRLLRTGGITATIWMFCGLILYFLLVCSLGIWGSGVVKTIALSQPGIVLDWEMATGYPSAAAMFLFCISKNNKQAQTDERLVASPLGLQVLSIFGWANIIIASISLCATFWKIWAFHQSESLLAASPFAYGVSGLFRIGFYISLMVGGSLFLLEGYTGWRLCRQDIWAIKTCMIIFSLEILYFVSFWGYAMYSSAGKILTFLTPSQPAIILDFQMVAGYPAAGIALLYCFQRLSTAETRRGNGE